MMLKPQFCKYLLLMINISIKWYPRKLLKRELTVFIYLFISWPSISKMLCFLKFLCKYSGLVFFPGKCTPIGFLVSNAQP